MRKRLTEHTNASAHSRSRRYQTSGHTGICAGGACETKRSTGALVAVACFAMSAPGMTLTMEVLCACNPVFTETHPQHQVQVTPSLQTMGGRSANRSAARTMEGFERDEVGLNESVA